MAAAVGRASSAMPITTATAPIDGRDDGGASTVGEFVAFGGQPAQLDAFTFDEAAVADRYPVAVDRGDGTVARDILETGGGHPLDVALVSVSDDRFG